MWRRSCLVICALIGAAACGRTGLTRMDDARATGGDAEPSTHDGPDEDVLGDGDEMADPTPADVDDTQQPRPLESMCDLGEPVLPASTGAVLVVSPTGDDVTGPPYRSLGGAAAAAQPGDVIEVQSGTYPLQNVSELRGAENSPIVIRPAQGATVVLDGSSTSPNEFWGALHASDTQYLIIDGFEITNASGRGVAAENVLGLTLQNLHVHDTFGPGIIATGTNVVIDSNHVHRAMLQSEGTLTTAVSGSGIGTNWWAVTSNGVIIRRNYVHDVFGIGISLLFTLEAQLTDNLIHDVAHAAFWLDHVRGVRIERNVGYAGAAIYDTWDGPPMGVFLSYQEYDPTTRGPFSGPNEEILVANNIFVGGVRSIGAWCDSAHVTVDNSYRGLTIAHNVLEAAETSMDLDGACATGAAPTALTFVNNVVREATSANVPTPDVWTHGNNCWQATSPPWQDSELIGTCELTSTTLPPAAGDFAYPTPSPLVGAGTAAPSVTLDRLCRPRSSAAPTIGAVE